MENLHTRLKQYTPIFLDHKRRVERTAGLDALLNAQFRVVNDHMNFLLEDYFIQNVQLETGAQPIQETDLIPIKHTEEVYDGTGTE